MAAEPEAARGIVKSVNIGEPHHVDINGGTVLTAIWKHPSPAQVAVRGVNLGGTIRRIGPSAARTRRSTRTRARTLSGGKRNSGARSARRRSARTSRSAACRYRKL